MTSKFNHQKKYATRQKAKRGMVQVTVWVPEDDKDAIKSHALQLRKAAKKR